MVYAQPDEEVEKLMIGEADAGGNSAEGIWSHPGDYTLGGTARAGDEEKTIKSRNLPSMDKAIWIYFDGGHRKEHRGVGGFVVFHPKG